MTKGITQETATGRDRHCVRRRPFWVRERAAIQYTSNSPFGRRGIGPCAGGGATRKNGMGFKQRERKRKKAAATAASEGGQRVRVICSQVVANDRRQRHLLRALWRRAACRARDDLPALAARGPLPALRRGRQRPQLPAVGAVGTGPR